MPSGLRRAALATVLSVAAVTFVNVPTAAASPKSELAKAVGDEILLMRNAANQAKKDNARFTQETVARLASYAPGYNIMVFKHMGTDAYDIPWFKNAFTFSTVQEEVLYQTEVTLNHYDSEGGAFGYDKFYIWVFSGEATFTNKGDGGYMNWAFLGYDRDNLVNGDRVIHFPRRTIDRTTAEGPSIPFGPVSPEIPRDDPSGPGSPFGDVALSGSIKPTLRNGRAPLVSGSDVVAATSSSSSTAWTFTHLGSGKYKIVNDRTGLALTENTKTYLAGASPWTGSAAQKWQLAPSGVGRQIRIDSDNCLTYDEDNKKFGVWTCTSDANQQWKLS
jgi:hypothetical protein